MMTPAEITTATRDELTDELAAAGEYTQDCGDALMHDLRERVRELIERYTSASTEPMDDGPTDSDAIVAEILTAKQGAGENAYLWIHDSGDVILWPSESASADDDGANAIARWQVDDQTVDLLIASGQTDETA